MEFFQIFLFAHFLVFRWRTPVRPWTYIARTSKTGKNQFPRGSGRALCLHPHFRVVTFNFCTPIRSIDIQPAWKRLLCSHRHSLRTDLYLATPLLYEYIIHGAQNVNSFAGRTVFRFPISWCISVDSYFSIEFRILYIHICVRVFSLIELVVCRDSLLESGCAKLRSCLMSCLPERRVNLSI